MLKAYKFLPLLIAILVGALYVAPQFLIRRSLIEQGKPFVLSQFFYFSDEAQNYLQRDREIYDGGFPAKDLFFDDGRPNIFPVLPAVVFTPFLWVFPDINLAYLAAGFVLSGVLFLLFYSLGLVLFEKRRLWALLLGLIATLTPMAVKMPWAFFGPANFGNIVLKNFFPAVNTLLDKIFLNRIDDPLITLLFYIPAIIFLIAFWNNPSRKLAILSGVAAASLFYVYFHYWTYWVIVLGLLLIYSFIFRKSEAGRWRLMLLMFLVVLVLSAPYWANYLKFNDLPGAQEYAQRIGIETGRFVRWGSVWLDYLAYGLLAAGVYFVLWRRGDRQRAVLFWVFLAAICIAWNIQLVTGFVPQPGHFQKSISPVYFVIVATLVYELFKNAPKKKLGIALLVLSALLVSKKVVNFVYFIQPTEKYLQTYTQPAGLVNSWNWINGNLPRETGIVSSSFKTSAYLAAFTTARPFLPWSGITPATNKEIEDRYIAANKSFGITEKQFENRLRNNLEDDEMNLYTKYYSDQGLDRIPDEKISELTRRYREYDQDIKGLDADYLYYGPDEQKIGRVDFSGNKNLELVYSEDSTQIYRILR